MKMVTLLHLTLLSFGLSAQNKNTIFYDSVGNVTTWEGHWAQVVTGRYKSVYHKSENKKTLARTTREEFDAELRKTEKRIVKTFRLGVDFPPFDVQDLNGGHFSTDKLRGKVIVLNFWFIGCGPCEMERPSLNDLAAQYTDNKDVVFLAFARDDKERLDAFVKDHPVLYKVIPTEKDFIPKKFDINAFPANIIVDKQGKYFFNSTASGIGIKTILQREIDKALAK